MTRIDLSYSERDRDTEGPACRIICLASDGLFDLCSNNEIAEQLDKHTTDFEKEGQEGFDTGSLLSKMSNELVELAYQKGSMDNISVLLVKL